MRGLQHMIRDEFDKAAELLRAGVASNNENPPLNRDMLMVVEHMPAARDAKAKEPSTSSTHFLLELLRPKDEPISQANFIQEGPGTRALDQITNVDRLVYLLRAPLEERAKASRTERRAPKSDAQGASKSDRLAALAVAEGPTCPAQTCEGFCIPPVHGKRRQYRRPLCL
jgi:hypothetical protein